MERSEPTARLSQGLDYYKATMSQVEHRFHPDAQVTFELKNRSQERLSDYVTPDELTERLAALRHGWTAEEIAYLAGLQNQDGEAQFTPEYLDYLLDQPLPPVEVSTDEGGELSVRTSGDWPLVTFWETVVMSELNELYFENKLANAGLELADLYAEGNRRLDDKIARLQTRPDIKFSDFGTRRRFSWAWQRHVVERLATELPENFVGTSNIALAHELGVKPIGTFAHELPMVYAGLADADGHDPLDGHNRILQDWERVYRGDLATALTDTFTSEFFFSDFTPDQAERWTALRHDSGDPVAFGERVIEFYQEHGIDPMTKTIVFSDGLDVDTIIALADHFGGRSNLLFGWGTTLTNDLGVRANNFVMKAVEVNGVGTVKLSDNVGKHTGSPEQIARYQAAVNRQVGHRAMALV
ncbi:MAG TPA: nicotinate phosphoribosyltransferase [Candidatus Saccharimonadales bacterium]|jgi:nicotinate phosphoribosyltransferase